MNLTDLQTFVRVAEHGSLTGAARELGVPKSTVSRRVSRLEDDLGLALVHRSGRSIALTERGEHLNLRSASALRELAEAERSVQDMERGPSGLLKITAPSDLGTSRVLTELFVSYRKRFPGVRLELSMTSRIVDLVGEGFDLALRPVSPRATWSGEGLKSRSLGRLQAGVYASPTYLQDLPTPSSPTDAASLDWIAHVAWSRGGFMPMVHRQTGADYRLEIEPVIVTNHIEQVLGAVLAHGGVGAVPTFLASPHVARGELVPLFEDWELPGATLAVIWPEARHLSPRVRSFIDHAVEALRF